LDRNAFKHELEVLEKVRHPNVLQFVGAVTQNIPMMIVSEYHPKVTSPDWLIFNYFLNCTYQVNKINADVLAIIPKLWYNFFGLLSFGAFKLYNYAHFMCNFASKTLVLYDFVANLNQRLIRI
jgi:serine/threonine protein kinase